MKGKRIISSIISAAMCMSLFANFAMGVRAENTYKADFGTLVKDSADTQYGTAQDKNIALDEYTTLDLSYEGTYVSADGKVYIKSGTVCNGNGKYAQGSHIAFTAPSKGELTVTGSDIGWFEENTYKGYSGNISVTAAAGTTYYFGYRKGTTYINSITFTPSSEPDEPEITVTPAPYVSPGTTWGFNDHLPATAGSNVPVISGQAEYDSADKSIKFPAGATGAGELSLDLAPAVKGDVEIEFDTAGHTQALGQQYEYLTVTNSEGDEIVLLAAHPYSAADGYAGVNKLLICGEQVAVDTEISSLFGAKATHVKLTIDYTARKVTANIGGKTFTGTIPAKAMKDLGRFSFRVSRNKTAENRYISFDNLSVKEFTSAEAPATDESLAAYTAATYGGVTSRVKAPSGATGKPIVIFLSSSSRFGTDNEQ